MGTWCFPPALERVFMTAAEAKATVISAARLQFIEEGLA